MSLLAGVPMLGLLDDTSVSSSGLASGTFADRAAGFAPSDQPAGAEMGVPRQQLPAGFCEEVDDLSTVIGSGEYGIEDYEASVDFFEDLASSTGGAELREAAELIVLGLRHLEETRDLSLNRPGFRGHSLVWYPSGANWPPGHCAPRFDRREGGSLRT